MGFGRDKIGAQITKTAEHAVPNHTLLRYTGSRLKKITPAVQETSFSQHNESPIKGSP